MRGTAQLGKRSRVEVEMVLAWTLHGNYFAELEQNNDGLGRSHLYWFRFLQAQCPRVHP